MARSTLIAAHAAWAGQSLILWAESVEAWELTATTSRQVAAHPYAADPSLLMDLLNVGSGTKIDVPLALATVSGRPVPSPQLLGEAATGTGRPAKRKLKHWWVPALSLDASAAFEALPLLTGDGLSGSVRALAALRAFADELAVRGRVLPVAVPAQWQPVLVGPDAVRARELVATLPPAVRAAMPDASAADVVSKALDALTDAAVRSRLAKADVPLLPPRRSRAGRVPLPERWINALTGPDELTLEPADDAELEALTEAIDTWWAEIAATAGPRQLRFRLAEPETETSDSWGVEVALQSTEDPSLVLPAEAIWAGETGGFPQPEEELLAGLGRAARIYPELRDELRTATPSAVRTDAEGAHRFITDVAPTLLAAGFGVQLPSWLGRTRPALKLTTRTSTRQQTRATTGGGLSQDDLVDFRFDVAIGDEVLSEDELADLARLKAPLVRLRGRWVEVDQERLRKVLAVLEKRGSGTMTAAEAIQLTVRGAGDGLPVAEVDADGWLGDLLSGAAEERLQPVATPAGFAGELRPYQERGLAWLSFLGKLGLGAVLADDMGLGKTVQMLALLLSDAGPSLLICPMSLVGNWQREAQRFAPSLRVHVHHGGDRLAGAELKAALRDADLVLTTYAVAARDQAELAGISWRRVVCDEAQFIKNSATRAARAVRALPASSRVALTGTPVENHLGELWSILDFTNPGLLGTATGFRRTFAVPIERDQDEAAAAALKRATGPFILRRVKTDRSIIADLPDKQEMVVWCPLTTEQATLYQATVDDMLDRIASSEGIERRGLVLATMAKLKQVCNHPAHLLGDGSPLAGRSGKLARLEEILADVVTEGEKALCFTQFAEFGGALERYLAARLDAPVAFLHGGVSKKARDAMVERFQQHDGPGLLLLSLKAGGTGLNLTAANHVIHYDRWWNPAVEDQATDRAFRIGQRKNVQVRKFTCLGTLEERIDAMITRKRALAERIVGTSEGWVTELSVGELRELVSLSPDAVAE
jgi:SNF2 family DNA or RNA helicase